MSASDLYYVRSMDNQLMEEEMPLDHWISRPFDSGLFQTCNATDKLRHALRILPCSFAHGTYIAGGLLVRAIMGMNEISDVDLFSYSPRQREAIIKRIDPDAQYTKHNSRYFMAVTLNLPEFPVQLCCVNSWPAATLSTFPSFHCMIATDGKEILYHKKTLSDIENRIVYRSEKQTYNHKKIDYWFEKYNRMGFNIVNTEKHLSKFE